MGRTTARKLTGSSEKEVMGVASAAATSLKRLFDSEPEALGCYTVWFSVRDHRVLNWIMSDKFEDFRTFIAVVQARGFAHAGKRLGIAKSAISRRVTDLEDRLGARLLNRTTRQLSPPPAGAELYQRGLQLLADFQEAEDAVSSGSNEPTGRLRVSAPVSFGSHCLGGDYPRIYEPFPASAGRSRARRSLIRPESRAMFEKQGVYLTRQNLQMENMLEPDRREALNWLSEQERKTNERDTTRYRWMLGFSIVAAVSASIAAWPVVTGWFVK
jgi:Bacterial regulatory helix-turn-helix protein, lysR family